VLPEVSLVVHHGGVGTAETLTIDLAVCSVIGIIAVGEAPHELQKGLMFLSWNTK